MSDKDYYRILRIDPTAEREVIRAAYRALAAKYHPDKNKSPDATRRTQELTEAYEVLGDPTRREQYDRELAGRCAQEQEEAWARREAEAQAQRASAAEQHPPVRKRQTKGCVRRAVTVGGVGLVVVAVGAIVLIVSVLNHTLVLPRLAAPTPKLEGPVASAIGQSWTRPTDGAEMVSVPAGEFLMGSADSDTQADSSEKPQHPVSLDAFWIDKYEVTNAQYRKCVESRACRRSAVVDGDRQPVVGVSWDEAAAYAWWVGGRLPTEAEWEKAARGTDGRIYPWGNEWDAGKANTAKNGLKKAADVGSYPDGASPYGALDMSGNVWEWVADWYAPYPSGRQVNPTGPASGTSRVLRGGSWDHDQPVARCAFRSGSLPADRGYFVGFRVAFVSPGSRR